MSKKSQTQARVFILELLKGTPWTEQSGQAELLIEQLSRLPSFVTANLTLILKMRDVKEG